MRGSVTGAALSIALALSGCAAPVLDDLGPLATVAEFNGDKARNEGRLEIGSDCVYLVHSDGSRTLLVWPARQVHWDEGSRTITYSNHNGEGNAYHHGDLVEVGGSEGSLATQRLQWVDPPSQSCGTGGFWALGDVNRL